MLKKILILILFSINYNFAKVCMPGINEIAPAFKADTNKGEINFPEDYNGKWIIFFSHPADFTPVCTTEFKKLAQMIPEFNRLNTKLVGLSVDSKYLHEVWIKELEKDSKLRISFPIVSDLDKKISKLYGMIHSAENPKQTIRALYFIDPKGKIRAILQYPIANGRSFKEAKRLLMALQITDKEHVATPADWQKGMPTIKKQKRKMAHY